MIEAVEVDADGMALSCRAYNLLHDSIVSMSLKENFVAILNDSQGNTALQPHAEVHRLSIQIERNTIVHTLPENWLKEVQSLIVSCDAVPSLSKFWGLQAMDLGGCDSLQVDHLRGIRKKTPLSYLAIGGKYIAAIPTEITRLKLLRTLDLTACSLRELPRCVLSLTKLERLFVNSHMKIPDKISKMSGLQELGDINIVKPELLKKLRELKKLRVLRIAMWSWDEGSVSSVKLWWETLHSVLRSCKKIETLSILTFCSLDIMDGSADKWPLQTLKNLAIRHSVFHDKLPSWFDSLSQISSLTIEVNKLSTSIHDTLGNLPVLCSLSLTSKEKPEVYFDINSKTFKKLESLKFVCNAMLAELFTGPQSNASESQQLKRLTIVFHALRTGDINKDFRFGLESLCSLQHVRVEINCFNANHQMVNVAEDAIRTQLSRPGSGSSQPNLEIRRLEEESMIAEEDKTTGHQKTEGNGDESDTIDISKSSIKTTQTERVVVGRAPISSAEVVSKVNSHLSSNNTFMNNVGILTSSTKIIWQELSTELQISTALRLEVEALKKKSQVIEQAPANTQREFEEFKKKIEENNLLLNRI